MERYQEAFNRAADARALFLYVRANECVQRVGTEMQRALDASRALEEARAASVEEMGKGA